MSGASYLKFLIVFVTGYVAVRVLFLEDEFSFYTIMDSLMVGGLAVGFTFIYEQIKKKAKGRNNTPDNPQP